MLMHNDFSYNSKRHSYLIFQGIGDSLEKGVIQRYHPFAYPDETMPNLENPIVAAVESRFRGRLVLVRVLWADGEDDMATREVGMGLGRPRLSSPY